MLKMTRRGAVRLAGGAAASLAMPSIARAKSSQPIFIVVPYAGGGSIDNLVRAIAHGMEEVLEQPVLVDNKPGANGIVGTEFVAHGPKDGSRLLAGGTGPISLNTMLRKNLPFKLEEFTSVAMLCNGPLTLTVNSKMPVSDIVGFKSFAKASAKPLVYATLGPGSVSHLFGIIMSQKMGFAASPVAYRNNPTSIMDLLSGAGDMNFATPSAVMEHVTSGSLKILAVSSKERMQNLPTTPTFIESGHPELTASFWTALHAPIGTPRDVVQRLNDAANKAMRMPTIARQLDLDGLLVDIGTPDLLDAQLEKDRNLWGPVIKEQNIVLE